MYGRIVKPFIANRDFIVFDQRGTSYSNPSMECMEISNLTYETLNRNNSMEDTASMSLSAISECKERLVSEDVDLSAYNSAENAADLASLRQSLGYDEWNLFGISYGTKLALTTMRDYPNGIRSVILDSAYPLQVDLYTSLLPNIDRALNLLFKECIEDKICDRDYPALESSFYAVAQRLDKYPASISTTHPDSGKRIKAVLNGPLFVNLIFESLYQTDTIPAIPMIINNTEAGNYRTFIE
jgi:pimeloyl-ACP methyl ester carboxylesterase